MDSKTIFKKKKKEQPIIEEKLVIDDDKPFKKLFSDLCLVKDVPKDQIENFKSLVIPKTIKENKNYGLVCDVGTVIKENPEEFAQIGDVVMMFPGCGHEITMGKNKFRVIRHKDFFGSLDVNTEDGAISKTQV